MSGVDTYRGIAYQHAQAVLCALDVLESDALAAIRVEGADDVIDIELLDLHGRVAVGKQAKVRSDGYTWAKADLIGLLRRWAAIDAPGGASFQFVTDGRLGPSGEEVRDALTKAAAGHRGPLAHLLGEEPDGDIVRRAARATIVQDPGGLGALLARADQQVMALLPAARSAADAREQAKSAVDALFRLLLDRACQPDSADRVVSRYEICAALGIPPSAVAVVPWAGEMRDQYLAAVVARGPAAAVPVRLRAEESPSGAGEVGVDVLLGDGLAPTAVAGRTGAGKSTGARELRATGAAQGRVVVVAHAETYIPGRVDALVADAVADVLGRDVPTLTGRQVLAEPGTVVVIDGVSEIPEPVRAALAEDLRTPVATGRGARLVLLGRGLAAVRSVFPASSTPSQFRMEPFGRERRKALAEIALGRGAVDLELDVDEHTASLPGSGERASTSCGRRHLHLGDEVTFHARHFGLPWRMTSRITAHQRPHRFVDEQTRGPSQSLHHEHLFEALPGNADVTGGTRMTDRMSITAPAGPMGQVVAHLVLAPYLRRLLRRRAAHIKRAAESASEQS